MEKRNYEPSIMITSIKVSIYDYLTNCDHTKNEITLNYSNTCHISRNFCWYDEMVCWQNNKTAFFGFIITVDEANELYD